MRSHVEKFDRFEFGEGSHCSIGFGSLIAPVVGGLVNTIFGDDDAPYAQPILESSRSPWAPAVPAAELALSEAQRIYGAGGFAPLPNPLELLGRENLLDYGEGALPGMIGAAQESWMRGLDPGLDPYVSSMIQAAQNDLVQDYQRNIMPGIADRAQAVGGYGGSRQGVAEGIAAEGLLEALGDVETHLLSDAYRQSLGQQRAAWGAAPAMAGLGFMPSQTQMDVGAMYRSDAAAPARNLLAFQSATQPYFTAGFGSSTQPNLGYQPPINRFLGGAFAGNQLWNDISAGSQLPAPSPLGGSGIGSSFLV